jgi:hypothetical protein
MRGGGIPLDVGGEPHGECVPLLRDEGRLPCGRMVGRRCRHPRVGARQRVAGRRLLLPVPTSRGALGGIHDE